jgi:hypothetical protein
MAWTEIYYFFLGLSPTDTCKSKNKALSSIKVPGGARRGYYRRPVSQPMLVCGRRGNVH